MSAVAVGSSSSRVRMKSWIWMSESPRKLLLGRPRHWWRGGGVGDLRCSDTCACVHARSADVAPNVAPRGWPHGPWSILCPLLIWRMDHVHVLPSTTASACPALKIRRTQNRCNSGRLIFCVYVHFGVIVVSITRHWM